MLLAIGQDARQHPFKSLVVSSTPVKGPPSPAPRYDIAIDQSVPLNPLSHGYKPEAAHKNRT